MFWFPPSSLSMWPGFHSSLHTGYTFNANVVGTKQTCQWLHLSRKDCRRLRKLRTIHAALFVVVVAGLIWWFISGMLWMWNSVRTYTDGRNRIYFPILFVWYNLFGGYGYYSLANTNTNWLAFWSQRRFKNELLSCSSFISCLSFCCLFRYHGRLEHFWLF